MTLDFIQNKNMKMKILKFINCIMLAIFFSGIGTHANGFVFTDSKVTSSVGSVRSAKTAAINYYQRYDSFPTDAETGAKGVINYKVDPTGATFYTPPVGDLDFGDVLVYQSMLLEQEKTLIGRATAYEAHAIGCATVGDTLIGGATYTGKTSTFRFRSSGSATLIVYYFMPNLTLREAATLAVKVNGPFTADADSDLNFVEASLVGNGVSTNKPGGLRGANCWFAPGANAGEYNAYLYVSHE